MDGVPTIPDHRDTSFPGPSGPQRKDCPGGPPRPGPVVALAEELLLLAYDDTTGKATMPRISLDL
ncbi:hypothetical protein AB0C20_21525, partial [Micromonospora sp. NPDC048843]